MLRIDVFVLHLLSSIAFSMLLFFVFIFAIHLGRMELFFDVFFLRLLGIVFLESILTIVIRKIQWYNFGKFVVCATVLDCEWKEVQKCCWDLTKMKFVKAILEEKKPGEAKEKEEVEKEEAREDSMSPKLEKEPTPRPPEAQPEAETEVPSSLFRDIVGKIGIKKLEEDCIWAYVCKHSDTDFKRAVAEAYTLLRVPSLDYASQLASIRVLENLGIAVSFVVLILWSIVRIYPSVMNVLFVLLLWKLLHSVLDDGLFRPLFSSMIWASFAQQEWKESYKETFEQLQKENAVMSKL